MEIDEVYVETCQFIQGLAMQGRTVGKWQGLLGVSAAGRRLVGLAATVGRSAGGIGELGVGIGDRVGNTESDDRDRQTYAALWDQGP